jgi:hypothetical protein
MTAVKDRMASGSGRRRKPESYWPGGRLYSYLTPKLSCERANWPGI